MAGLARLAKAYGAIVINGKKFVLDYANDKAVPEEEMPLGSERHAMSEKVKYLGQRQSRPQKRATKATWQMEIAQ